MIESTNEIEYKIRQEITDEEYINLEQELPKYGYKSLEKIITKDNEGNMTAKYVKAINENGQTVFIELDIVSNVEINPSDLVMTETKDANLIPYSIKSGAYNAAGLNVSGILFECKNGICSINRKPSSTEPIETNFVITENPNNKYGYIKDNPIPYPIIKFSEIQANQSLTLQNINDVTLKLLNDEYNHCQKSLSSLIQLTQSFNNNLNLFQQQQQKLSQDLVILINKLNKTKKEYNSPEKIKSNLNNYNLLIYNLHKRYDLIYELFKICSHVSNYNLHINNHNTDLINIITHINKNYDNLSQIYYP